MPTIHQGTTKSSQSSQRRYATWDRVAGEKRFSHPLCIAWMERYAVTRARILDFVCGHGRTIAELLRGGYKKIIALMFPSGCSSAAVPS
jgi:hypothetical protein